MMANNLQESRKSLWFSWNINLDEVPLEQLDHYIAVENYLTDEDELPSEVTYLEKVSCYTKSLHHLCQVRNWKPVQSILAVHTSINTTKVSFSLPFCEYLIFKGLSTKLLEVSDEIINSFNESITDLSSIIILKARALEGTGNLPEASRLYEELCLKSCLGSEIYIESNAHLAMAQVQRELYSEGIQKIKYSLSLIESFLDSHANLSSSFKFLQLKTDLLGQLAYYAMNLGKFKEAKAQYINLLQIIEENKFTHKIINPLVHYGIILRKEFRVEGSITSLKRAMNTAIEIEDEKALVWISHHLSWAFRIQKNHEEAEKLCMFSLEGYKNIDDKRGINDSYELLAWVCLDQGKIDGAIKNLNIALNWRKVNGIRQGAASCIMGLAIAYWRKGNLLKFVTTIFEGLNLYRKVGVLNWTRLSRLPGFAYLFRHIVFRVK